MDALTTLFWLTVGAWLLLEVILGVRDIARGKGRTEHDRGTKVFVSIAIGVAVVSATQAPRVVPSLRVAGDGWITAAGLIVMWLGLAIRVWAVVSLGESFRTSVEVDAGQAVVTSGPYRWVRHPSYTGLLLFSVGLGLGAGNWLSLAACAVVPALALLWRIRVEEDEMTRVLGDQYDAYGLRKKRLIPGLW